MNENPMKPGSKAAAPDEPAEMDRESDRLQAVLELWRDKKIRGIITQRIGFAEAARALEELGQRRSTGKIVLQT